MGRVYHKEVDALLDQNRSPLLRVSADAHRSADPQSTTSVLGGVGKLNLLLDVFNRDQPGQVAILVDHR